MDAPYRLPERIETARYLLRRAVPGDAAAIFESYAADPAVTRFLGWRPHEDVAQTEAFLHAVAPEWDSGRGYPLVINHRAAPDRPIGMFHPHVHGTRVNYGYVLGADAWGQGGATEILRWLVTHALGHPSIHRAEAFCDVENRASARVMEKAGMTCEGRLRRYFVHPNLSAAPRDCLLYARIR